jgi:hypothetical protein
MQKKHKTNNKITKGVIRTTKSKRYKENKEPT